MIRLAQFGLGGLGRVELDALATDDDVEIVAGADPVDDARELFDSEYEATSYRSYEDLLSA